MSRSESYWLDQRRRLLVMKHCIEDAASALDHLDDDLPVDAIEECLDECKLHINTAIGQTTMTWMGDDDE